MGRSWGGRRRTSSHHRRWRHPSQVRRRRQPPRRRGFRRRPAPHPRQSAAPDTCTPARRPAGRPWPRLGRSRTRPPDRRPRACVARCRWPNRRGTGWPSGASRELMRSRQPAAPCGRSAAPSGWSDWLEPGESQQVPDLLSHGVLEIEPPAGEILMGDTVRPCEMKSVNLDVGFANLAGSGRRVDRRQRRCSRIVKAGGTATTGRLERAPAFAAEDDRILAIERGVGRRAAHQLHLEAQEGASVRVASSRRRRPPSPRRQSPRWSSEKTCPDGPRASAGNTPAARSWRCLRRSGTARKPPPRAHPRVRVRQQPRPLRPLCSPTAPVNPITNHR